TRRTSVCGPTTARRVVEGALSSRATANSRRANRRTDAARSGRVLYDPEAYARAGKDRDHHHAQTLGSARDFRRSHGDARRQGGWAGANEGHERRRVGADDGRARSAVASREARCKGWFTAARSAESLSRR